MSNITFLTNSLGYGGQEKMLLFVAKGLQSLGENVSIINLNTTNDYSRFDYSIPTATAHIKYRGAFLTNYDYLHFVKNNAIYFDSDVLVGFGELANFSSVVVGKLKRIPSIVSERIDPFSSYKNPPLSVKIKLYCIGHADGAVFQTEGAASFYPVKLQKRSAIIPNPVIFEGRDELSDNIKKNKIIVTHGRLENRQKRIDVLIKGFRIFWEKHPEYKLFVYGTGDDESFLIELTKQLKLEGVVEFKGKTSNPLEDISKASIYAITSDYEGISNSLIEAMSVGLPVVSTNHSPGGARLLITDHVNGLLIPCNDPIALSVAFEEYDSNPKLAMQCGENAKGIRQRFCPDKILDNWHNYIVSIVNNYHNG